MGSSRTARGRLPQPPPPPPPPRAARHCGSRPGPPERAHGPSQRLIRRPPWGPIARDVKTQRGQGGADGRSVCLSCGEGGRSCVGGARTGPGVESGEVRGVGCGGRAWLAWKSHASLTSKLRGPPSVPRPCALPPSPALLRLRGAAAGRCPAPPWHWCWQPPGAPPPLQPPPPPLRDPLTSGRRPQPPRRPPGRSPRGSRGGRAAGDARRQRPGAASPETLSAPAAAGGGGGSCSRPRSRVGCSPRVPKGPGRCCRRRRRPAWPWVLSPCVGPVPGRAPAPALAPAPVPAPVPALVPASVPAPAEEEAPQASPFAAPTWKMDPRTTRAASEG